VEFEGARIGGFYLAPQQFCHIEHSLGTGRGFGVLACERRRGAAATSPRGTLRGVTVRSTATIRAGGLALVAGAVAFMAVFAYLAAKFNYPDVLDGSAADVLPALLATGASGRAAWAFYAFLPLVWIPAGVAAFHALRHTGEALMRVAMHFANLTALAMMLGLMRWPSFHWELASAYVATPLEQRGAFDAVFIGMNRYLGNYIGEFLGELSMSVFFALSGLAILRQGSAFPRWLGYFAIVTALSGLIGMFRNVTGAVAIFAEVNNYLLPAFMIAFGVSLVRSRATTDG
jgi:hypothetical protein